VSQLGNVTLGDMIVVAANPLDDITNDGDCGWS
jgi:hypothetical protein